MTSLFSWAWIAALAWLAVGCVQNQTVKIAPTQLGPFPAAAMAWTDADKAAQRQAGEKLLHDLQAAVASGAKTFVIPQGDYRFAKVTKASAMPLGSDAESARVREQGMLFGTPQPAAFIYLDKAKNLTIDGSGSTLWFEDTNTALAFNQCANVTLKNIAIDFDPLPFIQGRIVATHFDSDEIDVVLDAAYLDPRSIALIQNLKPNLRVSAFDPVTRLLKPNQGNFTAEDFWQNQIAPHTYRMKLDVFHKSPTRDLNLEPGDLVVLWRREMAGGRAVRLENCAGMVLENVTIYATAMTAFLERGSTTQTVYRHDNIIRRPGTNRLLACNGDALSVLTCMAGPLVEQCRMEYAGDDFINAHAWYRRPLVQESPTVVIAETLPHARFGAGTTVLIYDPSHGVRYLGSRRIVACEPTPWTPVEGATMIPKPGIPELPWTMRRIFLVYGTPIDSQRLTLDQPIELPENAVFAYPQFNNPGTVVRDCDFVGTNTRSILVRSPHMQVVGNRFQDIGGEAVGVDGEMGVNIFGESNYPTDVLIQGNHFTRCGTFIGARLPVSAVFVNTPDQIHDAARPDTIDGWVSKVSILDNVFTDCPREAIRVLCAKDLTIRGNTITGYNQVASYSEGPESTAPDRGRYLGMDHGIVLDHVPGLTLENNTLAQPGPASQGEYFRNEVTPAP